MFLFLSSSFFFFLFFYMMTFLRHNHTATCISLLVRFARIGILNNVSDFHDLILLITEHSYSKDTIFIENKLTSEI